MPLNENLTWGEVGKIVTDRSTGATVANAFQLIFGEPTKDLLPAGMQIYKFNSESSVVTARFGGDATLGPNSLMSPWWTASAPYKHDGGLIQKLEVAELNGVSAREWGRLTSVIKEDWNSLAYILEIELAEPVYGWFGGFKGMDRIGKGASMRNESVEAKGGSAKLPGGGTQFYIPDLKYAQVRKHQLKPL
jgi:hypothetical protein